LCIFVPGEFGDVQGLWRSHSWLQRRESSRRFLIEREFAGEAFWQAESCGHWVRDEDEWHRIAAYIENNP
jgi:hypothetical protein